MTDTVDAIRKVSGSVQDAIKDFVSDRADAGIASGEAGFSGADKEKSPAQEGIVDPLGKLGKA